MLGLETLPAPTKTRFPNMPLLAVTLPVTLTTVPVWLATLTIVVNMPLLAVTLPVAEINPAVNKLPPVTLAVVITGPVSETKLPVYVGKYAATLVFEYVPDIPVNCEPLPMKKLPVMLAVAEINPPVRMFPPVTLALALTVLAVITLSPDILPPDPLPTTRLPPLMLPLTETTPPVKLAVFTIVVNMPLLAVTLPLAL